MILGLSLCQAQIEVGDVWPHHSPTQNQGGVLSVPGWRSLSLGSGPVYDQGQGSSWDQGAGRSSPLVPPRTDPAQEVESDSPVGNPQASFRLRGWSRGSGDAQALGNHQVCLEGRGPPLTSTSTQYPPARRPEHQNSGPSLRWLCSSLWSLQRQVV